MVYTFPATEVKNRLGAILKLIYAHKSHIIVEKSGIPVAAIIPISLYNPIYLRRKDADPEVAEKIDAASELVDSRWSSRIESKRKSGGGKGMKQNEDHD